MKNSSDTPEREQIVVALTTWKPRINMAHKAIKTLLEQTLAQDRTVLYLAVEEFPQKENELPEKLLALQKQGLEIHWCDNIRSYKKLIYAIQEYPNAVIITADDDNYYAKNCFELLYRSYLENRDCIHCHRATKYTIDENGNYSYKLSNGREFWSVPSYLNNLVGAAGVLYPPHCFHPDITNKEKFMALASTNDDLWFWLMGVLAGYKVKVVDGNISVLNYVENTQDCALDNINNHGEKLVDAQFINIIKAYPQLDRRFRRDFACLCSGEAGKDERLVQAEREIDSIRRSASYKIGRFITFVPRKIKGFFLCLNENGAKITIERVLVHLHLKKEKTHDDVTHIVL